MQGQHDVAALSTSTTTEGITSYSQEVLRSALSLPLDARRDIAQALIWSLPRDEVLIINANLNKMLQKDIIGSLPPELAFLILAKLPLDDLLRCGLVSTTWNRLCNEQALWALLCASHTLPIKPARTSWSDISRHRQLMYSSTRSQSRSTDDRDNDHDHDDEDEMDILSSQGGMGGGGGIDPLSMNGGLRRSVWERGGPGPSSGQLPTYLHHHVSTSDHLINTTTMIPEPLISSHLAIPSAKPQANYKHLYIIHHILHKRMTTPRPTLGHSLTEYSSPSETNSHSNGSPGMLAPLPKPKTIDAISSVKSGGLPGHSEAVYSLSLIHHNMRMTISLQCPDCHIPPSTSTSTAMVERNQSVFDSMLTFTAVPSSSSSSYRKSTTSPSGQRVCTSTIQGRDWLLSGSRDKTLKLWFIGTTEPRVVKNFSGGHTGSVLTHCVVKVPFFPSSSSSSNLSLSPKKEGDKVKILAVSGGSDGKLCLWDIEGDGSPIKALQAHSDSILCVRGDDEHVVTCSKDKTIKLFDVRTLTEIHTIGGEEDPALHRGAVNAVGLSKDFIVSASGDKTIRIWSISDGSLLTCVEAHHRGIASIDYVPPAPGPPGRTSQRHRGTIITGSSDASMKMFDILQLPYGGANLRRSRSERNHSRSSESGSGSDGDGDLSFREMIDMDQLEITDQPPLPSHSQASIDQEQEGRLVLVPKGRNWASCVCPPGLTKPYGTKCNRCFNRGHTDLVRSVYAGEQVILSGSYDSSVKIWDRKTFRLIADLTGSQRGRGRIFAVVGDKTRIISSGLDCKINIWDFSHGLDTSFLEP